MKLVPYLSATLHNGHNLIKTGNFCKHVNWKKEVLADSADLIILCEEEQRERERE